MSGRSRTNGTEFSGLILSQRAARQLDEILASNPSAIFTFDLAGDVTYANARATELLGVRTGARRGIDF